jgi:hypothetical protein
MLDFMNSNGIYAVEKRGRTILALAKTICFLCIPQLFVYGLYANILRDSYVTTFLKGCVVPSESWFLP